MDRIMILMVVVVVVIMIMIAMVMMIVFVFDWVMMTMLRTLFCTIIIHYRAFLQCNHVSIKNDAYIHTYR